MNIKVFLMLVIAAAVVVALFLLITVDRKGSKLAPRPGTTHPTSYLLRTSPDIATRC